MVSGVAWVTPGNQAGPLTDNPAMECCVYREAASARLDGEALGMSSEALSAHLGDCADCAGWLEQATRLTRSARVGQAAAPDLADWIMDVTPMPRAARLRPATLTVLRISLAAAGIVQLVTSAPALVGDGIAMPMSTHAAHESAAWNVAVALGLLAVAAVPRRAAGALPVLGAFALILTVLSVPDWLDGAVDSQRLATHLGALAGVAIMLAIYRLQRPRMDAPPAQPGSAQLDGRRTDGDPPRGLRGVA